MPAVRNTPPRRRTTCPSCQRDMSYTHPWVPDGRGDLRRDYGTQVFSNHNDPATGQRCAVNGPHGLGRPIDQP